MLRSSVSTLSRTSRSVTPGTALQLSASFRRKQQLPTSVQIRHNLHSTAQLSRPATPAMSRGNEFTSFAEDNFSQSGASLSTLSSFDSESVRVLASRPKSVSLNFPFDSIQVLRVSTIERGLVTPNPHSKRSCPSSLRTIPPSSSNLEQVVGSLLAGSSKLPYRRI